jgi:predicted secreted acid phosphatase
MRIGTHLSLVVVVLLLLAVVPAATGTEPTSTPAAQIREYRESGDWGRDIAKQTKKAKAWLKQRTQGRRTPSKPALVLDIDETALDNYPCVDEKGGLPYDAGVFAGCVVAYDAPAVRPVLSLFKRAKQLGVAVFFVTGRPEGLRAGTLSNLRAAGYRGKYELHLRPGDYQGESAVPPKRAARKAIEKRGFTILANVGDQRSDLKGGYSERRYYLPNPIYFTE